MGSGSEYSGGMNVGLLALLVGVNMVISNGCRGLSEVQGGGLE